LVKNSSFGFSALAYVSAKTKCAVCAVGVFSSIFQFLSFFPIMHNVVVYGLLRGLNTKVSK